MFLYLPEYQYNKINAVILFFYYKANS